MYTLYAAEDDQGRLIDLRRGTWMLGFGVDALTEKQGLANKAAGIHEGQVIVFELTETSRVDPVYLSQLPYLTFEVG